MLSMNMKKVMLVSVMSLGLSGSVLAATTVDCHNAKNGNHAECARAKVNVNHRNDVVDCGNAVNANKDECVRAKVNVNQRNDVVDCSNAANGNKEACVRVKVTVNDGSTAVDCRHAANPTNDDHVRAPRSMSTIAMMSSTVVTRPMATRRSVPAPSSTSSTDRA